MPNPKRTEYIQYVPIRIEAQQPNGEWWVRSSMVHENEEVLTGEKPRGWLVAQAQALLVRWHANYEQAGKPLRISGIPAYRG